MASHPTNNMPHAAAAAAADPGPPTTPMSGHMVWTAGATSGGRAISYSVLLKSKRPTEHWI